MQGSGVSQGCPLQLPDAVDGVFPLGLEVAGEHHLWPPGLGPAPETAAWQRVPFHLGSL